MKQCILLFTILLLTVTIPFLFNKFSVYENYSNYHLDQAIGDVPNSQTSVLVQDTYPSIKRNELSTNSANDIWWYKPVFKLGSFKQITNNIKYPNNPDEGTCMPSSMCGSLYHDTQKVDNYTKILPPVTGEGTRVGYFTTNTRLIDDIPYQTDPQNVLY